MNETYQNENVHVKILVPSNAAGAIIGKGGEAIAQIQKESGAKVKMSKANDFYPGTTERVCLIIGTLPAVRQVMHYIMERVFEKPDPNPKPTGDGRLNMERHKQVKILVPNSTAGMIIGKAGDFIKKIKEKSGSFVQISQKAKEVNLPERCVIIAVPNAAISSPGELEQNKEAMEMILEKIAEDPQSNTCPQISYADVNVPVASAYPTGSPYATTTPGAGPHAAAVGAGLSSGVHGTAGTAAVSLDSLRCVLRNTGYSDQATEDIASAMCTLSNYGLFNMNSFPGMPHGTGAAPQGPAGMISPGSSFSLAAHQMAQHPQQALPQQDIAGTPMEVAAAAAASLTGFSPAAVPMETDKGPAGQTNGAVVKHDIEVPEALVGVIIGVGGTGIVKLQSQTQTNIQISKKGVYAPGTRNRVVTIAGNSPHVMEAASIIQSQVRSEEARRQTLSNATAVTGQRAMVEGNHGGAGGP